MQQLFSAIIFIPNFLFLHQVCLAFRFRSSNIIHIFLYSGASSLRPLWLSRPYAIAADAAHFVCQCSERAPRFALGPFLLAAPPFKILATPLEKQLQPKRFTLNISRCQMKRYA